MHYLTDFDSDQPPREIFHNTYSTFPCVIIRVATARIGNTHKHERILSRLTKVRDPKGPRCETLRVHGGGGWVRYLEQRAPINNEQSLREIRKCCVSPSLISLV